MNDVMQAVGVFFGYAVLAVFAQNAFNTVSLRYTLHYPSLFLPSSPPPFINSIIHIYTLIIIHLF